MASAPSSALTSREERAYGPEEVYRRFVQRRMSSTLRAYAGDLRTLRRARGWTEGELAGELLSSRARANDIALQWLDEMDQQGTSSATRARRLSAIRSFLAMARQLGAIDWYLDVQGPKVQKYRDVAGPSNQDTDALIAACGEGLEGLRNYALLLCALSLGLRRFELAAFSTAHLKRDTMQARVAGKGGKVAWLPIPTETLVAVDAWLKAWSEAHGTPADEFVFRSLSRARFGQPMTPKTVYHVICRVGKRAGVKVWPHALRHRAITSFLDETHGDMRAAQQFARHDDPKVTARYDDARRDIARAGAEAVARRFAKK